MFIHYEYLIIYIFIYIHIHIYLCIYINIYLYIYKYIHIYNIYYIYIHKYIQYMKIYKYIGMYVKHYLCEKWKYKIVYKKQKVCITSSVDLLYLMKTYWCRWIIFIMENLILLVCLFYFNIWLNNCLEVRERSSILLVALEILWNSALMFP